jgi:hypothetical protein
MLRERVLAGPDFLICGLDLGCLERRLTYQLSIPK